MKNSTNFKEKIIYKYNYLAIEYDSDLYFNILDIRYMIFSKYECDLYIIPGILSLIPEYEIYIKQNIKNLIQEYNPTIKLWLDEDEINQLPNWLKDIIIL